MFILLFDIDISNCCRCHHQYCLTLFFICVLLINRCGLVHTTETTASLRIGSDASATTRLSSIISPSPIKQPKPSSVIYISSLDGIIDILFFHYHIKFCKRQISSHRNKCTHTHTHTSVANYFVSQHIKSCRFTII